MKLDDFFEKSFLRNKIYRKKDIGLTIPMVASSVVRPGNEQPKQTVTESELVETIVKALKPVIEQLNEHIATKAVSITKARVNGGYTNEHVTISEFFNGVRQ